MRTFGYEHLDMNKVAQVAASTFNTALRAKSTLMGIVNPIKPKVSYDYGRPQAGCS